MSPTSLSPKQSACASLEQQSPKLIQGLTIIAFWHCPSWVSHMLIFFSVSGPVDFVPVVIDTPLITEHVSVTFSELIRFNFSWQNILNARDCDTCRVRHVYITALFKYGMLKDVPKCDSPFKTDENVDPFPHPSSSHFCIAFCLTHFSSSPSAQ